VDIPGLFGGRPGRRTGVRLEEDGTVAENEDLGSLVELRRASQLLTIELAGGSGYGDPDERSVESVQADLDAGLISAEGARAYGCEVDASGKVWRDSGERMG
jgi:N-methylhydantoinase B/oxoprolinase/acetone carboxylase alpha subunit